MQQLFLASDFSRASNLFPDFARAAMAGRKILFIPTAAVPERFTFYVRADKRALERLGFAVEELELTATPPAESLRCIAEAECLFIAGGNTFFLLQALRRSGADQAILAHIAQGKPYIGSSAGSVILAPDIGYVAAMDDPAAAPDLQGDFTALGAVPFYVLPHVGHFPFKRATRRILDTYEGRLPLRPLRNNQAIQILGEMTGGNPYA
jgi:dipeptidase E